MRPFQLSLLALAGLASTTCSMKLPLWKGEVKVTARERESIAKCGKGELTADGAKLVTRQPYLQATTPTSTVVAWGAAEVGGDVVVSEPDATGDPMAIVPAKFAGDRATLREREDTDDDGDSDPDPDDEALDADDILVMKAELRDLKPGTLYCYQVRFRDRPLMDPAPLVTASAPGGEPIRFVALGDTGTGSAAQVAIARRVSAEPFDFMVFLGDIAYSSGTPDELQNKFFAVYRDFMKYVPVYPSIGNHERRTRKGRPYFEAFILPEPERYYSFDWGDVHFVAIDTTLRDREQLAWLDRDLATTKQRWRIVFGHHPLYTNTLRGAQKSIRRAFGEILTRHKVDLVLTGHEHQYERFRVAGVNYIVSGGGGGQLYGFSGRSRALAQATRHHFLAFEVSATKLAMRVVDIEGQEIETVALEKPAPRATPAVEIDGQPDHRQNKVAPEQNTVPDEKLHDKPDDDTKREKVDPEQPTPPVKPDDKKPDDKQPADRKPGSPVATSP